MNRAITILLTIGMVASFILASFAFITVRRLAEGTNKNFIVVSTFLNAATNNQFTAYINSLNK